MARESLPAAADRIATLEELKRTIRGGLGTFVQVGLALKRARDEGYWKDDGYDSFAEWCAGEFQMELSAAKNHILSSAVVEILSGHERDLPVLPATEFAARPLGRLVRRPEVLTQAWTEAVETAPTHNGKPHVTAKHVKAVVKRYLHSTEDAATFPKGTYRVIYADPPWKYSDELIEGYGAADHHYPQMTIRELCDWEDENGKHVARLARANSVLFLWATSPLLEAAFEVVRAWEFEYKTSFVWDKVKHNYGHYNSVRHEFLLICTRGSCTPDTKKLHDSVIVHERSDKHSEKPAVFRDLIDEMYTPAKKIDRIELFARGGLPKHWSAYGNQAR